AGDDFSGSAASVSSGVCSPAGPAIIDAHVAAFYPSQFLKPLLQCFDPNLSFCIISDTHEHADASHPLRLLRTRRHRPRRSRAAEQRDELAALHSITSSTMESTACGTSMFSARAVCKFMTSSNLVDCSTGSSAGFSPLRILPA